MKYLVVCRICGKVKELDLDESKIKRWQSGELIQKVFPDLDADTREMMISGTCESCFEKMFAGVND